MKSTGIALAIIALIIFAIDTILKRKQKEKFKLNLKTILFFIAIITIVLLTWKCKIMIGRSKWKVGNGQDKHFKCI